MNGDPYDNSVPKYQSAQAIYDGLCELVQSEEMGILSEMFEDVSYEGQDYYYTDKGYALKEKFDKVGEWGNKLWLLDLAVWQIDENEVHDLVYEALCNDDLAKRLGFKNLFIEHMLRGDKWRYDEVAEVYLEDLHELNRFGFYEMQTTFAKTMEGLGEHVPAAGYLYDHLCSALISKARGLRLIEERRLIVECRALLNSYDDFILGLRMNQALYEEQERQYKSKVAQLQAAYQEKVRQLYKIAESQGISLPAIDEVRLLEEVRSI